MAVILTELLRLKSDLSDPSAIIPTNNKTKGQKMTLEEFKAYVEARQKISLEEALAKLTTRKEN